MPLTAFLLSITEICAAFPRRGELSVIDWSTVVTWPGLPPTNFWFTSSQWQPNIIKKKERQFIYDFISGFYIGMFVSANTSIKFFKRQSQRENAPNREETSHGCYMKNEKITTKTVHPQTFRRRGEWVVRRENTFIILTQKKEVEGKKDSHQKKTILLKKKKMTKVCRLASEWVFLVSVTCPQF